MNAVLALLPSAVAIVIVVLAVIALTTLSGSVPHIELPLP